jgi:hypothetical protein
MDERTVRQQTCPDYGRIFDHITGFVYRDDAAYAVDYIACHRHPEHDAWVDVIPGQLERRQSRGSVSSRIGPSCAHGVWPTVVADSATPPLDPLSR